MKTFTTVAVVASFLAVAPAYAHSHMSTPFVQGGNGGSSMNQIGQGGDGGSSMHHISQGGNGTDTGNVTDGRHDDRWTRDTGKVTEGRHDDRWTRDTDKVTDGRHDDRFRHVDSERRDRLRMLERDLARLLHRDLDGRGAKFVKLEIQRLRLEIFRLEHKSMIADVL